MSAATTRLLPRTARFTVQTWVTLLLSLMGVFVVVGAFIGFGLLNRTTEVSNYVRDVVQPARVEAYRIQSALLNQETGVRGYLLTADPDFLLPYEEGLLQERDATARLRELVGEDTVMPEMAARLLADVDAIESSAEQWRGIYVRPLLDGARAGTDENDPSVEAGRIAFDRIRTLFDVQNDDLTEARTAGIDVLTEVRERRDRVLGVMIVVFLGTGVGVSLLVRSLVVRPLERLRDETRVVAGGKFDEAISEQGPADIRAVARDVNAMRERLAHELELSADRRRQLENQAVDLKRSNSELEQFAYVASHDLQEPLRKVASFCQLIEKRYADELDDRGRTYIQFAVDGAKRMQVLINDLLTFSRVGRLGERQVPVALDEALDTALDNLSQLVEDSDARIERPDPLPEIIGEPTMVVMLLQNLVGNGIKFRHPDRAPVVAVTCDRIGGNDGEMWRIDVTDNGIGISEEFSEKVFVIFQRLHGRDEYGGTGIGLSLCRKIVEHYGGEIWVDTGYTGGTRFCFTIPIAESIESAHDHVLEETPV